MIRWGTFDEFTVTIPIPSLNLDFGGTHIIIAPYFYRPFYENYLGDKRSVFAWKFRLGPLSGCRIKSNEEINMEWSS